MTHIAGPRARAREGRSSLLARHWPASDASVPEIRHAVSAFALAHGADDPTLYDVALAVTEATANVVRHAYAPGSVGDIEVVAEAHGDTLEVVVSDGGEGLRAGPSDGLGVGLRIIAVLAASFAIRSRPGRGTEVWMRFLLPR